jgi:uncharacterized membrane protein
MKRPNNILIVKLLKYKKDYIFLGIILVKFFFKYFKVTNIVFLDLEDFLKEIKKYPNDY